ncbi:MAG: hydroxyphenylacetyl-CoA thioesterase PaaI [Candidatus Kapaibacteriales bacterium]
MNPDNIVSKMMEGDFFSQWMGVEVLEVSEGSSLLSMIVRKEMLNGFSILHGGVSYALADSALAFAANSHGIKCVSTTINMSYPASAQEGDQLIAEATEISITKRTAVYDIEITNQNGEKVGLMRGTVYRTSKEWEE